MPHPRRRLGWSQRGGCRSWTRSTFAEIEVAMLYIDEARERAERAAKALRAEGADTHLIEALERSTTELSDVARRLRQGTYFAVPKEQLNL